MQQQFTIKREEVTLNRKWQTKVRVTKSRNDSIVSLDYEINKKGISLGAYAHMNKKDPTAYVMEKGGMPMRLSKETGRLPECSLLYLLSSGSEWEKPEEFIQQKQALIQVRMRNGCG